MKVTIMNTKFMAIIGASLLLLVLNTTSASSDDVSSSKMDNKSPDHFTTEDVGRFLRSTFGGGGENDADDPRTTKILETFREHDIDGSILVSLTDDDLIHDLGMTKLQVRKFQRSLDKLVSVSSVSSVSSSLEEKESSTIIKNNEEQQKTPPPPKSNQEKKEEKNDEPVVQEEIEDKTNDEEDSIPTNNTNFKIKLDNEKDKMIVSKTKKDDNKDVSEYCSKLCAKQWENIDDNKYKKVVLDDASSGYFRLVVKEWNKDPESSPYGPIIGCWDVSEVTDMSGAFINMKNDLFNKTNNSLQCWDTSSVTSMTAMFDSAETFNESIDEWDVSNVLHMNGMFFNAKNFNSPLKSWNTHNVKNMAFMFAAAENFDQDIGSWDVFEVEDTESMFDYAKSFNQNLNDWQINNAHNMNRMFYGATNFRQNLCRWKEYQSIKSKQKKLFEAAGGRRGRDVDIITDSSTTTQLPSRKLYNKDTEDIFHGTSCPEGAGNDPSYTSNWCTKC